MGTNAIVRVPIEQQPTGLLAVSANISQASTPQRLLLDTTFPSVLFTCDSTRPNAACTAVCDFAREPAIFIYPNGGNACLNAESTAVSLGNFSTTSDFKAGPIARLKKTDVLGPQKATAFDGVLGIGLPELPRHPTVPTLLSGHLAKLWGTYSLVIASMHNAKRDGSHLLIGGVDDALVSSSNLIAHEVPALPELGWTLDLRGVFVGSRASAVCETGCMAMINTASAVIRMPAPAWKELEATLDEQCEDIEDLGDELVHVCEKDVQLPTLGFVINGKTLYVAPKYYTAPLPSDRKKVVVLVSKESMDPTTWTLGAPFVRAFPSSFSTQTRAMTFYCKLGESCVTGAIPMMDAAHGNAGSTADATRNNSRLKPSTTRPKWTLETTSPPSDISATSNSTRKQTRFGTALLITIPVFLTVLCAVILVLARRKKKRGTAKSTEVPAATATTAFATVETPANTTSWVPSAPPESPSGSIPIAQLVPSAIPSSSTLQVVQIVPSAPDHSDVL